MYKIEKENLDNILIEKEVVVKVIKWSLLDLLRSRISLETETSSLIMTKNRCFPARRRKPRAAVILQTSCWKKFGCGPIICVQC